MPLNPRGTPPLSAPIVNGITKEDLVGQFADISAQYPDGPVKSRMLAQFETAMQRIPDGATLPVQAGGPVPGPTTTDESKNLGETVPDCPDPFNDEGDTQATQLRTVLHEAADLIGGQREDQYGNATESFARIAGLWSAYLGVPLEGRDVANLMVLMKVSRAKRGFHRDSYVDIAGYAALAERIAQ